MSDMTGYKQEQNTNGSTMKQKVRFILKNRGVGQSAAAPAEKATDAIETAVGSFVCPVGLHSVECVNSYTYLKE